MIDAWLRAELLLKGTVIYERLAGEYGFAGNYQRVKIYLQEARPRIAAELVLQPHLETSDPALVVEPAGAGLVAAAPV